MEKENTTIRSTTLSLKFDNANINDNLLAIIRTHVIYNKLDGYFSFWLRALFKITSNPLDNKIKSPYNSQITSILRTPEVAEAIQSLLLSGKKPSRVSRQILDPLIDPQSKGGKAKGELIPELAILKKNGLLGGVLIPNIKKDFPIKGCAEVFYTAFSYALTRLKQVYSLNKNQKELRKNREEQIQNKYTKYFNESWWKKLDEYEEYAQNIYIKNGALDDDYRINGKTLIGWNIIRNQWIDAKEQNTNITENELNEITNNYQNKNPRRFGNHLFFQWAAKPDNWEVWDGRADTSNDPDPKNQSFNYPIIRKQYTKLLREVKGAGFCWPDPLLHPKWVRFGEGGGSDNLECGSIIPTSKINLYLITDNYTVGKQFGKSFIFNLGSSERINRPTIQLQEFVTHGKHREAEISDAQIIINRNDLFKIFTLLNKEERKLLFKYNIISSDLITQITNIIYNKMIILNSISVSLSVSVKVFKSTRDVRFLNKHGILNNEKLKLTKLVHGNKRDPYLIQQIYSSSFNDFNGLKCLAIDLGIRNDAAFSILELTNSNDISKHTNFSISENYKVILRKTGKINIGNNSIANAELQPAHDLITELNNLLNLRTLLVKHINNSNNCPLNEVEEQFIKFGIIDFNSDLSVLSLELDTLEKNKYKEIIQILGHSKNKAGDISIARIEFLGRVERLFRRFASRWFVVDGKLKRPSKRSNKNNRLIKLREKIRNLKEDRCKKIAAEIVKMANKNDCKIIVFEDLSRYLFSDERPRYENAQLQNWCHRAIVKYAISAAELYGIEIGIVPAQYSSRFDAKTMAPGRRAILQPQKRDKDSDTIEPDKKVEYLFEKRGDKLLSIFNNHFRQNDADINASINIGIRLFKYEQLYLRANFSKKLNQYIVTNGEFKNYQLNKINDDEYIITENKVKKSVKDFDDNLDEGELSDVKTIRLLKDPSKQITDFWMIESKYWELLSKKLKNLGVVEPAKYHLTTR